MEAKQVERGSAKRMRFLQQEWELTLDEQDIEFPEMESRIDTLEDEVAELHQELSHAAEDIQELRKGTNSKREKRNCYCIQASKG